MNSQDRLERLSRSQLIRRLRELESAQSSEKVHTNGGLEELAIQQAQIHAQNQQLRHLQAELELSRDRYAELCDFAPIAYGTLAGSVMRRRCDAPAV